MARQQRLTEHVRGAILQAVLDHAFKARKEELKRLRIALADEVYHDVYSDLNIKAMVGMPEGYLDTSSYLHVRFGTEHEQVHWDDSVQRRIAFAHRNNRVAKQYPEDHYLSKLFSKLEDLAAKLETEESSATASTKAALKAVRSYEKLIEVWPEIEPLARPFHQNEARATSFALALPIADLNKALGLPPQ